MFLICRSAYLQLLQLHVKIFTLVHHLQVFFIFFFEFQLSDLLKQVKKHGYGINEWFCALFVLYVAIQTPPPNTQIFYEFHIFLVLGSHQFLFSTHLFCKIPLNYLSYTYNFSFVIQHFCHIGAHNLPFCLYWLNNNNYYLWFCFYFENCWLFLETNWFWRTGSIFSWWVLLVHNTHLKLLPISKKNLGLCLRRYRYSVFLHKFLNWKN